MYFAESPARIRIGLDSTSGCGRAVSLLVDQREVRHQVEPSIGRRLAGAVEPDSAEAS